MEILKHQVFYFCKQDMIFVFLRNLVVCKLNKDCIFQREIFCCCFCGKKTIHLIPKKNLVYRSQFQILNM